MVNCKTERDAKFVHDLVRGLVGFGRLNTPDNQPDLLKLYDAIQVTQQQAQTKVTADVPQELADKFLDLWLNEVTLVNCRTVISCPPARESRRPGSSTRRLR